MEQVKTRLLDETRNAVNALQEGSSSFETQLKQRVLKYCKMNYNHTKQTKVELRTDTVCMRESPFFVDTVRDFRDRRYDYKRAVKREVNNLKEVKKTGNPNEIDRV